MFLKYFRLESSLQTTAGSSCEVGRMSGRTNWIQPKWSGVRAETGGQVFSPLARRDETRQFPQMANSLRV